MRVLFAGLPEKSHVYTTVPLAWALTVAGHEVLMANTPSLNDVVTGAGLVAAPVGTDHEMHREMAGDRASQDAEVANWSRLGYGDVDYESLVERYKITVPYGFARYNDPIVDDLVALARDWKPDLVIRDPLAYAGGIAARAAGAVHARLLWCADVYGQARSTFVELGEDMAADRRADPLADWLTERGQAYGVPCDEELINGQYTIETLPPSLRPASGLQQLSLRYLPYNGRAVQSAWMREQPKRPRICVTLGVANTEAYNGDYVDVPGILQAMSRLDAEVVAALLPEQAGRLGDLPASVTVVSDIALGTLLPSCSAIVHHGGFGTFSTALINALPQLALSTFVADQEFRGRTLEEQGAGLFLHHADAAPDRVADLAQLLLEDSSYTAAARRLRDESAAMPTPHDLVIELEALVAAR